MALLNRLVEEMNTGREHLAPWFDPDDGGTSARALFLHENPGRRATTARDSGFISADNNDDTAANFFRCCATRPPGTAPGTVPPPAVELPQI